MQQNTFEYREHELPAQDTHDAIDAALNEDDNTRGDRSVHEVGGVQVFGDGCEDPDGFIIHESQCLPAFGSTKLPYVREQAADAIKVPFDEFVMEETELEEANDIITDFRDPDSELLDGVLPNSLRSSADIVVAYENGIYNDEMRSIGDHDEIAIVEVNNRSGVTLLGLADER